MIVALVGKILYGREAFAERYCLEKAQKWFKPKTLYNHFIDITLLYHFDLKNSGDKTFTIPLIRLRGRSATQNLILNPGGPGGGGFDLIYRLGEQLNTIVGEGFHLLSFDPRGVNSSTPLASCYPDGKTRQELSRVRFHDVVVNSPELYAWTQNFVRACSDTMGEYAKYINTPQTAADMNSILNALGQKDMAYWGFSYGTLLGQTYSGLFPERSKRVVIDGVVDQFEWYEGLYEAEALVDTDAVLDGFFDECIKAGVDNCSLASLATTTEELRDTVLSYMRTLREQPISVYVNNTFYGVLDYDKVWYNGVFPALNKPVLWTSLAEILYNLMQGNATDAFFAYRNENSWQHEASEFVTLNDGVTGPDHWPQDRQSLLDRIVPLVNQSLFGASLNKMYYMRQQWTVPRTHPYVPRKGVKTAHPLLILTTTYDPVCPLMSARSANLAFDGSQIVEIKGYGHCSPVVTSCEVDSPYFARITESSSGFAQKRFEDPEEERIHLAQLELARKWSQLWLI
ncbi:hypothetical protein EYZ11_000715 [Aspergillus tanneri]|uniref:AB hydrolase-1 domain-containing protein n=1 Tax=Aspergillus tanneri TaxID=1220188 RepID=A0A4S3JWF3_9EURO|nr:hypothetical protein EYZ11_000715 [Aspergillus tanneri]